MNVRYIFLLLIPAFFTLSSCSSGQRLNEGFFDFSSDVKQNQAPEKSAVEKFKSKELEAKTAKSEDIFVAEQATVTTEKQQEDGGFNGETVSKRFSIGYLTFDVADVYGEFKEVDRNPEYSTYKFRFYSKSNGFVDYLFGWMSHTISTMKVYKNKVVPVRFQTKTVLKKKNKEMELSYNDSGHKITFENVTPPDNRGKRPAVDNALKLDTYDPLTLVIEARRRIMNAYKENSFVDGKYSFSLPLYDGRRRSDVNLVLDQKKVGNSYHLKINQKAIAGYTNNEWADIKKGEKTIDMYIDPISFWPTSAIGRSAVGSARAKFVEDCTTDFEECISNDIKIEKKSN